MINIQLVRFILLSNKEVNLILHVYAKQYFCSLKINVINYIIIFYNILKYQLVSIYDKNIRGTIRKLHRVI